jgi:flavin-binding protein dodecin
MAANSEFSQARQTVLRAAVAVVCNVRKTMKTYLLKVFAVLAMGTAVNGHAQTDALSRAETTVPELSDLNIQECVMVLNLKTEYQVNLEIRDYDYRQPQYRLDLVGLKTRPIEQVLSNLLVQTGDYVFVETNKTVNLVPKERWKKGDYVFDSVLQEYDVDDQNLVGAFEQLYRQYPQVALVFPAQVASDSKPEWIAEEKREQTFQGWAPFSLKLRAASVRTILDQIVGKTQDSFWVAQPSAEIPPKWQWISIFRRDYGKDVLWKHDPGLREQFEKLMHKKMQQYEDSHPAKNVSP